MNDDDIFEILHEPISDDLSSHLKISKIAAERNSKDTGDFELLLEGRPAWYRAESVDARYKQLVENWQSVKDAGDIVNQSDDEYDVIRVEQGGHYDTTLEPGDGGDTGNIQVEERAARLMLQHILNAVQKESELVDTVQSYHYDFVDRSQKKETGFNNASDLIRELFTVQSKLPGWLYDDCLELNFIANPKRLGIEIKFVRDVEKGKEAEAAEQRPVIIATEMWLCMLPLFYATSATVIENLTFEQRVNIGRDIILYLPHAFLSSDFQILVLLFMPLASLVNTLEEAHIQMHSDEWYDTAITRFLKKYHTLYPDMLMMDTVRAFLRLINILQPRSTDT
jgi:hypothetical protein